MVYVYLYINLAYHSKSILVGDIYYLSSNHNKALHDFAMH